QVIVNALPSIANLTTTASPAAVCEDVDMTFTANATASGASLTYEWYYAASEADANSQQNSTKVTADAMHVNPTGKTLTLKTKGNQSTLNGRWYYAKVTAVSTGADGCSKEAYTTAAQAVIHPLPDTANIVTDVTIGGQNVAELYTCAGKGTEMEVKTDGGKVPTDGSFAYSWTKGGGALPSGVTKTDLAGNAGSKLTFSDAAAITANSGTYTLSLTVTTDEGCTLTLKRDLKIHFETCGKDKVSDGQGTEHTATVPFVLCANDGTWPDVQIEAADLTDGAAGTAKVTKITLYHSAAADMTGETEVMSATPPSNNNPPLKTLKFEVDAAATDAKYKTTGSHYYRGKIERDGYAPTYTDIVEYVIGAVPDRTLTGSVQAWSHADGLSAEIDGPTADLKVCAGLMVNLKLSAAPADGSLTETGGQGGDYKWYRNSSLSASATAPDDPTGLAAVAGSLATTNLGKVASGGANDGLYYAYREYTRSTDIHTGSVSTKTCKTLIKVPGGAKVQVKPMPAKPTAIAGGTKNLCDGDVFDLTTTTTPATAPDGAAWTYRWYKRAHGESLDKPFNPTDYSQTLPDLTAIPVTASGSTGTVTDVYKLKVYLALDGCYDSTLLSGITVNIAPRPSLTKPTVTPSLTGGAVCAGSSLTLTAATTPTPSGATLHYQWFKLKGATADTSADDKVGGDAATYTISSAAATDAGKYYVRVQALSGNCEAKALSDLTTVTVNPLPAPTYVQKIDGVAQTGKTVCKESEPTLLVEASVASGSPAYSYAWQSPASGTGNSYKVPQSATASEGDLTYTVKVKATENGCSSAERTLTFNVKVVDCSNDLIEDGNGKNFEVCAGETAADEWPTVKITANDHAGAGIDKIELYHHTANSTTGGTLIATLTPASGTTAATLEFKPFDKSLVATPSTTLTPSFGSIDFKTPSSTGKHFYYAMVSRSGGTDTKTTAVVEYMVGAMPDKDVVLGTGANTVGILISEKATLVDAKVNGDDNTLTICAGQDAYLHLNNLPSAADLTADNTTLTKYDWYKNNSAHSGAIPDNPAGMGTRFGTAATEKLDVVTGISAQRKDYYYAYLS
ncbi:MAG: hypothetical protein K2H70_02375, partial [Bacteroidales bacterium]|nr:hypothetical protein [Bacteroidales bacterium]